MAVAKLRDLPPRFRCTTLFKLWIQFDGFILVPSGIASHGTNLCALHRKLDDAARHVEEAFRSTTMAELLGEQGPR